MSRLDLVTLTVLCALPAAVLAGCGSETPSPDPDAVTFSRDIAPIVFENCAACHHTDGVAPFSLLSYEEAKKRARQMAEVTATRFMPPWLPKPGLVELAGDRRLSDEQVAKFREWYEAGTPEGDPSELPPAPRFSGGWQLGKPDLVLEMGQGYTLPPEGLDVFRNFVFPSGVSTRHWVRAVEFRPTNPRVVHHAVLQLDRTRSSRQRDEQDPGPGFEGMYMGESFMPDGQFLGWTPGKVASPGTPGIAWRLDERTDLVLQLHMPPTGKPEPVGFSLGLYFAQEAPTIHPFALMLSREDIDIPAGENEYWIEDRFELPAAVDVLGLYPHTHYLGKEIRAWAELPDGGRQWLIHIEDWDFNWQDDYRFARPLELPEGAELVMRYKYDNSAENVHNPHSPPRRVRYGTQSSDEMANLLLEVVPRDAARRPALEESALRVRLERSPDSWRSHNQLGLFLVEHARHGEAIRHYEEALKIRPEEPELHFNLGTALATSGRAEEGLASLRETVRLAPTHVDAYNNMGLTYHETARYGEAVAAYRRALRFEPDFIEARNNLALALHELGKVAQREGRFEDAGHLYAEALEHDENDVRSRYNLAVCLVMKGEVDEALPYFRRSIETAPDFLAPMTQMAWTLATHPSDEVRQPRWALPLARLAAELSQRRNPVVLDALAAALASSGDVEGAITTGEEAARLATESGQAELAAQVLQRVELYRKAKSGSR